MDGIASTRLETGILAEPKKKKVKDDSTEKPVESSAPVDKGWNARKQKRLNWVMENMKKRMGNEGLPLPAPQNVKGEEDADSRQRPLKKFSVFVGQIPFNAKKEEVHKMFEDIAKPVELKNFRWQTDPKSKRFRGFAFVEFGNKGSYLRAFELHGALINGRPITVEATTTGGKRSSLRKEKIKEKTTTFRAQAVKRLEKKAKNLSKKPINYESGKTLEAAAEPWHTTVPIVKNEPRATDSSGNQNVSTKNQKGTELPGKSSFSVNPKSTSFDSAQTSTENPQPVKKKKHFRPFNKGA